MNLFFIFSLLVLEEYGRGIKAYSVPTVVGEAVGAILPPARTAAIRHFLIKGVVRPLVTISSTGIFGAHDYVPDTQAQVFLLRGELMLLFVFKSII